MQINDSVTSTSEMGKSTLEAAKQQENAIKDIVQSNGHIVQMAEDLNSLATENKLRNIL